MSGNNAGLRLRACLAAAAILCLSGTLRAGREPESWDVLPDINEIYFTPAKVGFAAPGGPWFIFDRGSRSLSVAGVGEFSALMRGARGGPAEVSSGRQGDVELHILAVSDGTKIETSDAYCSEGLDQHHSLSVNGSTVTPQAGPCRSITTAEIENGRLWLGTRQDGEYGEYPGEGIVIQSLADGSPVARLSRAEGLSGNLVRVIKADPYAPRVWAATHLGITELSTAPAALASWYFYEGFGEDGLPAVQLSSVPRPTDFLAVFAKKVKPKDPRAFHEAVLKIPAELRAGFTADNAGGCCGFLPEEFNSLLPFVLASADFSPDEVWYTFARLCLFKDKGVAALLASEYTKAEVANRTGDMARQCLFNYKEAGLLPDKLAEAQVKAALGRIAKALAGMAGFTDRDFQARFDAQRAALEGAASMAEMGDPRGVELLNGYFMRSKGGNSEDAFFFSDASQKLHYSDEFLPGIMAGVRKFYGAGITQGCMFLDMRYPAGKNRLGPDQLGALVAAVENASHPEYVPHQPSQAQSADSACRPAAISQMKDGRTREKFYKAVYPTMTLAQKRTADELAQAAGAEGF